MKEAFKLTICFGLTFLSEISSGQKKLNPSNVKAAQDELDKLSIEWKARVEEKYSEAGKLSQVYALDNSTVSIETRRKREEEIKNKLLAADDLRVFYFGPTGEIFKRRQELVNHLRG